MAGSCPFISRPLANQGSPPTNRFRTGQLSMILMTETEPSGTRWMQDLTVGPRCLSGSSPGRAPGLVAPLAGDADDVAARRTLVCGGQLQIDLAARQARRRCNCMATSR